MATVMNDVENDHRYVEASISSHSSSAELTVRKISISL